MINILCKQKLKSWRINVFEKGEFQEKKILLQGQQK